MGGIASTREAEALREAASLAEHGVVAFQLGLAGAAIRRVGSHASAGSTESTGKCELLNRSKSAMKHMDFPRAGCETRFPGIVRTGKAVRQLLRYDSW